MPTKEFLKQTRVKLEEEKKRIEQELNEVATKDPKASGRYVAAYEESGGDSEDDNSVEVTSFADELSLVKRLETELRDTIRAMEAIDKGGYGICKYCKKEIDLKRLKARPTSSTCIACKKLLTQEM